MKTSRLIAEVYATQGQALSQTERERRIVRPGPRRLIVRAILPHAGDRILLTGRATGELDRHPQRIADHAAEEATEETVFECWYVGH